MERLGGDGHFEGRLAVATLFSRLNFEIDLLCNRSIIVIRVGTLGGAIPVLGARRLPSRSLGDGRLWCGCLTADHFRRMLCKLLH